MIIADKAIRNTGNVNRRLHSNEVCIGVATASTLQTTFDARLVLRMYDTDRDSENNRVSFEWPLESTREPRVAMEGLLEYLCQGMRLVVTDLQATREPGRFFAEFSILSRGAELGGDTDVVAETSPMWVTHVKYLETSDGPTITVDKIEAAYVNTQDYEEAQKNAVKTGAFSTRHTETVEYTIATGTGAYEKEFIVPDDFGVFEHSKSGIDDTITTKYVKIRHVGMARAILGLWKWYSVGEFMGVPNSVYRKPWDDMRKRLTKIVAKVNTVRAGLARNKIYTDLGKIKMQFVGAFKSEKYASPRIEVRDEPDLWTQGVRVSLDFQEDGFRVEFGNPVEDKKKGPVRTVARVYCKGVQMEYLVGSIHADLDM